MRNRWHLAAKCKVKVEWDFEDRLVKVIKNDGTIVENTYDVDGVLVRTSVNGVATDLLVDTSGGLSHVVAEVGSGGVDVVYVRAGDMLLEEIRAGVAKMYEADGLGSTRSLLDTTGARTDTWSYEAFGSTVSSTGTSVNPYRFAGERYVGDVGMYQNRARWYTPATGGFISVDPEEGQIRVPVTFHGYLYGQASPANLSDPTGRMSSMAETMVTCAFYSGLAGMAVGGVSGAINGAILYGPGGALEGLQSGMVTGAISGALGGGLGALAVITRHTLPFVAYTAGMTGLGISEGVGNLNSDDPDRRTVGGIQLALSVVGGAMGAKAVSYLNTGKAYLPLEKYQRHAGAYEAAPDVPVLGEGPIPDGSYIFVVRMDRTIAYYARGNERFPHPFLSKGENVLSAGEMTVAGGRVSSLTNQSGHFQPSSTSLYIAEIILRAKGLWGAGATVSPFKP